MKHTALPWYVTRPAWPLGVGLLVLLTILCVRLWLHSSHHTGASPTVPLLAEPETLKTIHAMQQQQNDTLRQAIVQAKQDLASRHCEAPTSPETQAPARVPESSTSGQSSTNEQPPENPPPVVAQSDGHPLSSRTLQQHIAQAVVLVAGNSLRHPGNQNIGTGFFITPHHLVTNAHVVDDADPSSLLVYHHLTDKAARAKVVNKAYQRDFGARDYAILEVRGMTAPGILPINPSAAQLQRVVSAGYPGVYRQVISGIASFDKTEAPPFVMTDGIISSINSSRYGIATLSHTAELHGGNSGGPLVNRCGEVVGINTFIATPGNPPAHINFALGGDDLATYLKSQGLSVHTRTTDCE